MMTNQFCQLLRRITELYETGNSAEIARLHAVAFPKFVRAPSSSELASGEVVLAAEARGSTPMTGTSPAAKPRTRVPVKPLPALDVITLESFENRADLEAYLNSKGITKKHLIDAARGFDITGVGKLTKPTLIDRIVDAAIGHKLRSRAIQAASL